MLSTVLSAVQSLASKKGCSVGTEYARITSGDVTNCSRLRDEATEELMESGAMFSR